jgi:hypothetical protein
MKQLTTSESDHPTKIQSHCGKISQEAFEAKGIFEDGIPEDVAFHYAKVDQNYAALKSHLDVVTLTNLFSMIMNIGYVVKGSDISGTRIVRGSQQCLLDGDSSAEKFE